jgi:hypothetical protein
MMTNASQTFEKELEIFGREADATAQFFYAYLAIHATAARNSEVANVLKKATLFWNTTLAALQTSAFIALGRVFDTDTKSHGVHRLLDLAEDNPEIFSLDALAARKQANHSEEPDWLDDYLASAYVPSAGDFQELRRRSDEQRAIYENIYKRIRNRIFAHKDIATLSIINDLFSKTNVQEWQVMAPFLQSLHEALWQLYVNGKKPVLRNRRHSVDDMLNDPLPAGRQLSIQERITREAADFLAMAAGGHSNPLLK